MPVSLCTATVNTCMYHTPTSCHCGGWTCIHVCCIVHGIRFTNHSLLYSANVVHSCAHQSKTHAQKLFHKYLRLDYLCTVFLRMQYCEEFTFKSIKVNYYCDKTSFSEWSHHFVNNPIILWITLWMAPQFWMTQLFCEWPHHSVNSVNDITTLAL